MSRVCPVLGKGPVSGNNRSHSLRATRRRWNTNLQVRTVVVDGKEMRIRMSTRAYRHWGVPTLCLWNTGLVAKWNVGP